MIAAIGNAAALAAKAATTTIPIVFLVAEDPVKLGLVASLARPGGNVTGINFFTGELAAKRLELLRELVPASHSHCRARQSSQCCDYRNHVERRASGCPRHGAANSGPQCQHQRRDRCGLRKLMRERPDALFVGPDPFFNGRRVQLANLASRHALPATYSVRDYAEAGGLMSYGANIPDAYRQVGVYTGRILKGAKPADLPVVQATKFELVINAETARMLGLTCRRRCSPSPTR